MRLTMYLYLYILKWYCWKRGLFFTWRENQYDKTMVWVLVTNRRDLHTGSFLSIAMNKKPIRKPYQIYNRLRNLIRCKMVFKRKPIKRHDVDLGCYEIVTYC